MTGELISECEAHSSYITAISCSENLLVSSSGDKTVKIWQIEHFK